MTTTSSAPRRRFLRWLGHGALGAAAITATGPAAALQVLPNSDYATVIETGCGPTAAHRKLLADAAARLGVTLSDEQKRQALAALTCPACGCPLVTAATGPDGLVPPTPRPAN